MGPRDAQAVSFTRTAGSTELTIKPNGYVDGAVACAHVSTARLFEGTGSNTVKGGGTQHLSSTVVLEGGSGWSFWPPWADGAEDIGRGGSLVTEPDFHIAAINPPSLA